MKNRKGRIGAFCLVLMMGLGLVCGAGATGEGAEKKHYHSFSILGDSYSTYYGWLEEEDAAAYYPENDVLAVEQTWWYQFAENYKTTLIANNSWSGSTIGYDGYREGLTDWKGFCFIERRHRLGDPELILVFGGTNDSWVAIESGRQDFLGDYQYDGFTEDDFIYFRPALAYLLSELQTEYPAAQIVFMLNTELDNIAPSVMEICGHYEVPVLVLEDFSKIDRHPDVPGMTRISEQLIAFLDTLP